jgi:hypothetical protein
MRGISSQGTRRRASKVEGESRDRHIEGPRDTTMTLDDPGLVRHPLDLMSSLRLGRRTVRLGLDEAEVEDWIDTQIRATRGPGDRAVTDVTSGPCTTCPRCGARVPRR